MAAVKAKISDLKQRISDEHARCQGNDSSVMPCSNESGEPDNGAGSLGIHVPWKAKNHEQVKWQWEHRAEGWQDYDEDVNLRIEEAYQAGKTLVRLKRGKDHATPMELFLVDMIQFNPMTKKNRKIRRIGKNPVGSQMRRNVAGIVHSLETGKPRVVKFSEYQEERTGLEIKEHRLARGLTRGLPQTHSDGNGETGGQNEVRGGKVASLCNKIVKGPGFFPCTMAIVLLNAVWIGWEADHNDATVISEADLYVRVTENAFCCIFVVELTIRFLALPIKKYFFKDRWFLADLVLVLLMVAELWILPIVMMGSSNSDKAENDPGFRKFNVLRAARLLRLARLGRVARLLRVFPEVMTLLKGIAAAARSVFFTLLLLLMLIFAFGIVFKTQSRGLDFCEEQFQSVGISMWILLLRGTFMDDPSEVLNPMLEEAPALTIAFLVFIFLASFTVLNMLIGILCEVVHEVSKNEREAHQVSQVKRSLWELMECYDRDNDQTLTKDEFDTLLLNPELHLILKNFGVDAVDLLSLKDVLFDGKGKQFEQVQFDEFLEVVVRLRGGNNAHVMDIVDLREYVRERIDGLESRLLRPMPNHGSDVHCESVLPIASLGPSSTEEASFVEELKPSPPKGPADPLDAALEALEAKTSMTQNHGRGLAKDIPPDDGFEMLHNFLAKQAAWQEYFSEQTEQRWKNHEKRHREIQAKQMALTEQVAHIQKQLQHLQDPTQASRQFIPVRTSEEQIEDADF